MQGKLFLRLHPLNPLVQTYFWHRIDPPACHRSACFLCVCMFCLAITRFRVLCEVDCIHGFNLLALAAAAGAFQSKCFLRSHGLSEVELTGNEIVVVVNSKQLLL